LIIVDTFIRMRNRMQQLERPATETPVIGDYEWGCSHEQLATIRDANYGEGFDPSSLRPASSILGQHVLAVRPDLGKNGGQAIKETISRCLPTRSNR
jgi:hypothetical protein